MPASNSATGWARRSGGGASPPKRWGWRVSSSKPPAPEIWASVVPINDASAKVLDKNGFAVVGAGQVESEVRGHPLPVVLRKLTRAAWTRHLATQSSQKSAADPDRRRLCAGGRRWARAAGAATRKGKAGGLWEFPAADPSRRKPEQALIRELKNSTSMLRMAASRP